MKPDPEKAASRLARALPRELGLAPSEAEHPFKAAPGCARWLAVIVDAEESGSKAWAMPWAHVAGPRARALRRKLAGGLDPFAMGEPSTASSQESTFVADDIGVAIRKRALDEQGDSYVSSSLSERKAAGANLADVTRLGVARRGDPERAALAGEAIEDLLRELNPWLVEGVEFPQGSWSDDRSSANMELLVETSRAAIEARSIGMSARSPAAGEEEGGAPQGSATAKRRRRL